MGIGDWEEFDFKIGDITRNISPQDDGLTLAWLDTFEDIGDKTCLGKVKEFANSSNEQIRERALEVFYSLTGVDLPDKEYLKESRGGLPAAPADHPASAAGVGRAVPDGLPRNGRLTTQKKIAAALVNFRKKRPEKPKS